MTGPFGVALLLANSFRPGLASKARSLLPLDTPQWRIIRDLLRQCPLFHANGGCGHGSPWGPASEPE